MAETQTLPVPSAAAAPETTTGIHGVDCSQQARLLHDMAMLIASEEGGPTTVSGILARLHRMDGMEFLERRTLAESIAEASQAKAKTVDELQQTLNGIRREARGNTSLIQQIDDLMKHLREGTLPSKQAPVDRATAEIKELRAIRAILQTELRNSPPALKQRLEKSIAELTRRLEENDFAAPVKQQEVPADKQLQELVFRKAKLQRRARDRIESLKPKTLWTRIAEPINTARAIKTSMDLSGWGRQGGMILFSNPQIALKAFVPMVKAATSDRSAYVLMQKLDQMPMRALAHRAGLHIPDIHAQGNLSQTEEYFLSRWAHHIWGVGASERAYNVGLSYMRMYYFTMLAKTLARNEEATGMEAERLAHFVNVMTGRGSLGRFEPAGNAIATVFFAPRYVMSRTQLMFGEPLWAGNARTRFLIGREYLKLLTGLGTVMGLAALGGAIISGDPTNPDFGKLKWGDNRVDLLGGISQLIVLGGREIEQVSTASTTGEKTDIGESHKFGRPTQQDMFFDFLKSKSSPIATFVLDQMTHKDFQGRSVDLTTAQGWGNIADDMLTPMSIDDVISAAQHDRIPTTAAMTMLSVLGASTQIYGPQNMPKLLAQQSIHLGSLPPLDPVKRKTWNANRDNAFGVFSYIHARPDEIKSAYLGYLRANLKTPKAIREHYRRFLIQLNHWQAQRQSK